MIIKIKALLTKNLVLTGKSVEVQFFTGHQHHQFAALMSRTPLVRPHSRFNITNY